MPLITGLVRDKYCLLLLGLPQRNQKHFYLLLNSFSSFFFGNYRTINIYKGKMASLFIVFYFHFLLFFSLFFIIVYFEWTSCWKALCRFFFPFLLLKIFYCLFWMHYLNLKVTNKKGKQTKIWNSLTTVSTNVWMLRCRNIYRLKLQ